MANVQNLRPVKKGEVRNPKGRPTGTKNRSTVTRLWMDAEENVKNPITKELARLSQEDISTLSMIKEARSGNVAAYKALMDNLYGAPSQQIEQTNRITIINDF